MVEHAIRSSKGQGLAPASAPGPGLAPGTTSHGAEGAGTILNRKADFLLEIQPSSTCANLCERWVGMGGSFANTHLHHIFVVTFPTTNLKLIPIDTH